MHTMHSVGRLMLMAAGSGSTSRVEPTGAVLLVVLPRMNSMTHEKLNWLRPIKTIQVSARRVPEHFAGQAPAVFPRRCGQVLQVKSVPCHGLQKGGQVAPIVADEWAAPLGLVAHLAALFGRAFCPAVWPHRHTRKNGHAGRTTKNRGLFESLRFLKSNAQKNQAVTGSDFWAA